jgi:hypothetical protein
MLASRSAIPSASSPKAGSRTSRGTAWSENWLLAEGVVMEARRLVRECGRRGVVGREGKLLRVRDAERARDGGADVGVVDAMVRCVWFVAAKMRLDAINCFDYSEQRQACRRAGACPAVSSTRQSLVLELWFVSNLFPIHSPSLYNNHYEYSSLYCLSVHVESSIESGDRDG